MFIIFLLDYWNGFSCHTYFKFIYVLFIDLKMRFKTNVISKGMCDISLNQLSYPKSISSLPYIFQPYQQNCSSSSFSFLRPSLSFLWCFYWRRRWHPTPVLLPGKSHGWRSLVGCSPWGCKESDTSERLHFHLLLSRIGEGNSNPFQCYCLENPRDGGASWASIYGIAQSWVQLKQLSSSSSSCCFYSSIFHWFYEAFPWQVDRNLCAPIICWGTQFSSVAQSCPTLCNPMDYSRPGFAVHHQLLELTQTHVHWVNDAIQPSHPLSSPSPPASIFPSMRVFSNESGLCIGWPKFWSFSFNISPSNEYSGWFPLGLTGLISLQSKDSQESSPMPQSKSISFFGAQLSLWSNSHICTWLLEKP